MKPVLMFLFLVAGGIANADPYTYTLTGTTSGFYLPGAAYDGYFGVTPGGTDPVAFADQPFRLTLDTSAGNIYENYAMAPVTISIGAWTGSLTLPSYLITYDHTNVDFAIDYLWYSSGDAISMHPQAAGFDGQAPFNFGDTVGSESVAVNLWLYPDGFGQLIPTTFGMVRLSSMEDATFTAAVTATPEPACAESFLIGGIMLLLISRHRRRTALRAFSVEGAEIEHKIR
jgi:hypothetical protein